MNAASDFIYRALAGVAALSIALSLLAGNIVIAQAHTLGSILA